MSQEIKKQNEVVKQEVKSALTVMEKDIADQVFNRVNQMESSHQLMFPPNYAVGNALKSAYLQLQESGVLEKVTRTSVANTLLDMVIQGLSPAKKQCYFIPYGQELKLFRSYFGDQVAIKNALGEDIKVSATVIYEDDEVEIGIDDNGFQVIESHKTEFGNRDKGIQGAYATIVVDGIKYQELMTWAEIQKSWSKAKTKNVQNDFPQEMAKRTVIRRLCKRWLNTSTDSNLFAVESYNRTTEGEYDNSNGYADTQEALDHQVDVQANSEELIIETDYEDVTSQETPQETPVDEPAF